MIDKRAGGPEEAVSRIPDGATVMVGGFGESGRPNRLLAALLDSGARGLTIISNNAGEGTHGMAALLLAGRVEKLVCSFPRGAMAAQVEELVRAGTLSLDVMPQGTLAERIRAAGAGIPAFYTPTSFGTVVAEGKETRDFDGRGHVLETALRADFALIKARRADRWGNLDHDKLARNFSPLMATAAEWTIAEADEIVELGGMHPEHVVTPGIFVDAVTLTSAPRTPAPHKEDAA